jgi:hypothetical protein
MIDLAISIDDDARGLTIVETNHGDQFAAANWPQDSDFRLVAFSPGAKVCDVIPPVDLAQDIALALEALEPRFASTHKRPAWYRRLRKYAAGARRPFNLG